MANYLRRRLRYKRKRFAFCLSVRGFVRLTIRETLTFRAFERERRTFPVIHFAGVKLEIPFDKVAVQMGFAYGMVGTKYCTLHQAETTTLRC
jgi:hypothetical protein